MLHHDYDCTQAQIPRPSDMMKCWANRCRRNLLQEDGELESAVMNYGALITSNGQQIRRPLTEL